ncbi:putative ribonuclease H-like domain-containing protein [Tanacetum coccineum]
MCDKKNSVLFTDTECFVLSPDFKLPDESQVLLKVPRKNNMYSVDMKNIVPKESLTCLVAKVTLNESMLWHMRLGHINFKTINKLVKDNLVRDYLQNILKMTKLVLRAFKGKQHKASCKSKIQISITQPLFMLHMDLFGPTFVSSLMNKKYCLVVTDDYSRFTWVFFLASKDETSGILKNFITEIENLVDKKVKIIRCDNGTEFKNIVMNERKGTLIEAVRTMLADSKLPTTYWAEAVNTACYVQNRFNGKSNNGFFVRYSLTSKAFRVYNIRTRKVEENLHIRFLENKPIVTVMAEKKDDEGVSKASGFSDQEQPESSTPNINTDGPRFPAQSVGSSNTDVLDSPCLLVLITGMSQSRQHVITSLIHIESCKSPTKSLFDVGSSRISIFTVNLSITRMSGKISRIIA